MRNRGTKLRRCQSRGRIVMIQMTRVGAIAIALACAIGSVAAQTFEPAKYPDWSGQWTRLPDGSPPRYDPSKPIRQQQAPLKPEYEARFRASIKDQDDGGFGLDLSYACI